MTLEPLPFRLRASYEFVCGVFDELLDRLARVHFLRSSFAVALCAGAACLLTWPPDYLLGLPIYFYDALVFKSTHPLTPVPLSMLTANAHSEKIDLRLTAPILAWLVGAPVWGVLIWSHAAGVASLGLVHRWIRRWTGDALLAALAAFGLAGSYWGHHFFSDAINGDGIAYCLMLCALAAPVWPLAFAAAFGADFCDERAAFSTPLLLLCLYAAVRRGSDVAAERNKAAAIAVAVPAWILVREGLRLTMHFAFGTKRILTFAILLRNLRESFPDRFIECFGAAWLFVLLAALALLAAGERRNLAFFGGALVLGAAPAFLVVDFSRSMAFVFPAVLFGVLLFQGRSARRLAAAVAFANLLNLRTLKAAVHLATVSAHGILATGHH